MQRALFYTKHTDKFTSPKHNLLVFQVKLNYEVGAKLVKLVHSIFRKENSTMGINGSYFGVLHWQQWQLIVSAPALH